MTRVHPDGPIDPTLSPHAAHLASVGLHGTPGRPAPTSDDIIHAVARSAGVDTGAMLNPYTERTAIAVRARQCGMLLLRRWLCMSYPEIARALGYASHGPCLYGVQIALCSAYGIGGMDPWAARLIEAAAIHLFDDFAPDAIHLAIPPIPATLPAPRPAPLPAPGAHA